MSIRVRTQSADATKEVAAALASIIRPRDVLVLSGDLGGGKTAFVQGLAAAFEIAEPVTSPTFALVQTYRGSFTLHHLDAYRLQRPEEVIDLNLPELLEEDAVIAIEWGERVLSELPDTYLVIRFSVDSEVPSPDVRIIEFEPIGESWTRRHSALTGVLHARCPGLQC